MSFNEKQLEALKYMNNGKNVFITGPGGVGKSYVIDYFASNCTSTCNIIKTSSTGVSALLINGITIHSWAGLNSENIQYKTIEEIIETISDKKIKNWLNIDILIIDEISMIDDKIYSILYKLGRKIRDIKKPFGGIQIILSGDFLQLPPVENDYAFMSKYWNKSKLKIIELTENYRQADNKLFNLLNNIRRGQIRNNDIEILKSRINKKLENTPTILFATNKDVDNFNNRILLNLKKVNESKIYYSKSEGLHKNSIYKYILAPRELEITINSEVMLLVNLDLTKSLCNGSVGKVIGYNRIDETPIVKFEKATINIKPYIWKYYEDIYDNSSVTTYEQIPLKLIYASTIHKSQGRTLNSAIIDLKNITNCGQAYVALSRIKSIESLSIINYNIISIKANKSALAFYTRLNSVSPSD